MQCAPTLTSRCLISFVPFSARFGFALRAFNLFAPSPCTSMCIHEWVCICSFLSLCMSAIDSLQTHTHARLRTYSHIETRMGREAHREGGWKNDIEAEKRRQRQRQKITFYIRVHTCMYTYINIGTQDDYYAVRLIYDRWRVKAVSHFVPFRWRQSWR